MSSGYSKMQVLSMYKLLMRESQKFPNYNFRAYALRRVRDAFKENKTLTDHKTIKKEMEYANDNLNSIRRQTAIGNMFKTEKLVIENLDLDKTLENCEKLTKIITKKPLFF